MPLIVTGAVLVLLVAGCGADSGAGGESERAAVNAYVAALNAKDAQALRALAHPGNDAEAEIADRVGRLGGRGLRLRDAEVLHEFEPDFAQVRLATEAADGSAGEERIVLSRVGGRWYLALGQSPAGSRKPRSSAEKPAP
ncbi:hypothetical protein ACIQV3_39980 [Streptomyces sp. NPDC099050]|uniref:hypothetical protein n=1 Tax=Streptomyces sp. NPDC099050 TaxID=3366100 RepID=UPI00382646B5